MINKNKKNILYTCLILLFLSFTFQGTPPKGWYLQTVDLQGRQINDIVFFDSLTGLMMAVNTSITDSSCIFKTTNGGDNWFLLSNINIFTGGLQFLNENTGYAYGGFVFKTTNQGINWVQINLPEGGANGFYALNEDTIWIASGVDLVGGLYRTTNGGQNWIRQFYITGSGNPDRVYFVNKDLGFISYNGGPLRRTTNGGFNWSLISGETYWVDIHFENDTVGWKSRGDLKKTINGGLTWQVINLPQGGISINGGILSSNTGIYEFSFVNKDTIWGSGSRIFYGSGRNRGLLYISTNQGETWGYQLPDTGYQIIQYFQLDFTNKLNGWAYPDNQNKGVHTVTGGDSIRIITDISTISTEIPERFELYQNYPNPFNPVTKIKFSLKESKSNIKILVYDVNGKLIETLLNSEFSPGTYEVTFDGSKFSSGVYFYTLETENLKETKKMLLLK